MFPNLLNGGIRLPAFRRTATPAAFPSLARASSEAPYRMACRECTLRWDGESGIVSVGIACPLQLESFRFPGRSSPLESYGRC